MGPMRDQKFGGVSPRGAPAQVQTPLPPPPAWLDHRRQRLRAIQIVPNQFVALICDDGPKNKVARRSFESNQFASEEVR